MVELFVTLYIVLPQVNIGNSWSQVMGSWGQLACRRGLTRHPVCTFPRDWSFPPRKRKGGLERVAHMCILNGLVETQVTSDVIQIGGDYEFSALKRKGGLEHVCVVKREIET